MFFVFSSDIFVTLRCIVFTRVFQPADPIHSRIYAITSRNKILAVYLTALVLARLSTELVITFVKPPVVVDFPLTPVGTFNLCTVTIDLRFMLIPNSIGTAFGTWSHSFPLLA